MTNSTLRWAIEDEPVIFENADPKLVERFRQFHADNGFVYARFFEKALAARAKFSKYSAVTIIHSIRWERDLQTDGEVFKINNDYIALYSRLLMHFHPSYFGGFFETRAMVSEKRQISDAQRDRESKASGF
jgi:hypothetical protein